MGFALTLVYIVLAVLSPAELFPELAPYRIMLWLAAIALVLSLPQLCDAKLWKRPQFYLFVCLALAICLSRLMNDGIGGVRAALTEFLPGALVFFLTVLNVNTIARFRRLAVLLILLSLYLVIRGMAAYFSDDDKNLFVLIQPVALATGEMSQYLRIRGLSFLSDPNDFAQFLLMLLPFLLLAWNRHRMTRSFLLCVVPAAAILLGVYLTFSRGALIAVAVLAVTLLKDRIGGGRSAILAPLVVAVVMAFNQSGRAMSIQDASAMGRINAWSDGLGMFRSSPLWGIGFGRFLEYHERTAHNSFVLCFAELGLIGFICWVGMIVAGVLGVQAFMRNRRVPNQHAARRWAVVVRASLYAVLVTSWFLSRTFCITLYLMLGMAATVVTLRDVPESGNARPLRWQPVTLLVVPALIAAVYITVRMRFV
jgi:O-antigen ligase